MLRIEGLRKIYPGGKVALDGVTFSAGIGVFGLLGPNGAGKSSLLEILSANQEYETGTITLGEKPGPMKSPTAWRAQIGYMPQAFDFPTNATGRELLREAGLLLGLNKSKTAPRIEMLLKKVNLSDAANRYAAQYSRGMKQRLGIALALLHAPPLLLFDEPTAGLDPVERNLFRLLLKELGGEHVVILSTHIVHDVEQCCTSIGVLDSGKIVYQGTPAKLIEMAAGAVWQARMTTEEIEEQVQARRAVSVSRRDGHSMARIVSERPPVANAEPVPPTLEDAYFHLLGGRV